MNAELAARLESLEAERLRPVPAKPPSLPAAASEAFKLLMDRLVELPLADDEAEEESS
ncbi:hypothetical protein Sme01_03740 [Sphaerisporangium melleum]|uniref:Uncharacterized protein n=1 Tax=Sphaerisporangium melleum TaxID=321316 RepID=A0A917QP30_9ACTN|nr:hypothetical protein [Sphaerisporangium melleum]GGK61878.1 hypothetical protein GCM10007964_01290 [Sphaerisporangium melleum]GII67898.1 hypothetical protein Sme01_03740 [Sphaerisporangium melleum]